MTATDQELEQVYDEILAIFVKYNLNTDQIFSILAYLRSAALRDEVEEFVRNFMYKNMR